MTAKKRFGVPFASVFLLIGALVLLGFLPHWTRKTHFSFDGASANKPPPVAKAGFPMERAFTVAAGRKTLPKALQSKTQVSLAELAAHSPSGLILNFWATWCPPCLDELPGLDYLNRQLSRLPAGKLPLLVTISVDEVAHDVSGLFETLDFSPSLLVLHDPNGYFSASVGTTRFPETYWIDGAGAIRYKWIGPQNWLSEEVLVTLLSPPRT